MFKKPRRPSLVFTGICFLLLRPHYAHAHTQTYTHFYSLFWGWVGKWRTWLLILCSHGLWIIFWTTDFCTSQNSRTFQPHLSLPGKNTKCWKHPKETSSRCFLEYHHGLVDTCHFFSLTVQKVWFLLKFQLSFYMLLFWGSHLTFST